MLHLENLFHASEIPGLPHNRISRKMSHRPHMGAIYQRVTLTLVVNLWRVKKRSLPVSCPCHVWMSHVNAPLIQYSWWWAGIVGIVDLHVDNLQVPPYTHSGPLLQNMGINLATQLYIKMLCFETETLPVNSATPAEVGRQAPVKVQVYTGLQTLVLVCARVVCTSFI